jgi:hypothetical protein
MRYMSPLVFDRVTNEYCNVAAGMSNSLVLRDRNINRSTSTTKHNEDIIKIV